MILIMVKIMLTIMLTIIVGLETLNNLFWDSGLMGRTIISGVFVFIAGQLFIEYVLKPIQEFKKLKAKIAYNLVYYAHYRSNPKVVVEDKDDAWIVGSKDTRKLAAEVAGFAELKVKYNFFILNKKGLDEISKNLIGLSNSFIIPSQVVTKESVDYSNENEIRELLGMKKIGKLV